MQPRFFSANGHPENNEKRSFARAAGGVHFRARVPSAAMWHMEYFYDGAFHRDPPLTACGVPSRTSV
jgi:hypothetical protein